MPQKSLIYKNSSFLRRAKNAVINFRKNNAGFGAIEAALTLPIFIGITMAMIDYGLFFTKQITATANASNIISTIQNNPTLTEAELNDLIAKASNSLVDFNSTDACISTMITSDQAAAYAFVADKLNCDNTKRDVATDETPLPYFIATKGVVTYKFVTPINSLFTGGETERKITFGQVARFGTKAPPVCNGIGEALQFDGTEYQCAVPKGTVGGQCVEAWGGWGAGSIGMTWGGSAERLPAKAVPYTPVLPGEATITCGCEAGWERIFTGDCAQGDCVSIAASYPSNPHPEGGLYYSACIKE